MNQGGFTFRQFREMFFQTDVLVSSSIILILMIMILPISALAMDFLLAINISLSLIVLLVAFYTLKPLQFAVFPGMLLILTLFRLSLNVGTTRLILSEGYAGSIVDSFGGFIVRGNFVIGIDRKSTRLNSSHVAISYAVFCLKKKTKANT